MLLWPFLDMSPRAPGRVSQRHTLEWDFWVYTAREQLTLLAKAKSARAPSCLPPVLPVLFNLVVALWRPLLAEAKKVPTGQARQNQSPRSGITMQGLEE